MKKYVLIVSAVLVLGTSPAYAQVTGEPEVTIPDNPPPIVVGQYGQNSSGGSGDGDGTDSGGQTTIQSIEEGLEDAVEDVEPGAGNEAVVGTGSYVESLTGSEPVAPVEAAEPSEPETTHDKPSDTYAELPDTGGVPPATLLFGGAGAILAFGVISLRTIRRR